jgi:hypothetical protein
VTELLRMSSVVLADGVTVLSSSCSSSDDDDDDDDLVSAFATAPIRSLKPSSDLSFLDSSLSSSDSDFFLSS